MDSIKRSIKRQASKHYAEKTKNRSSSSNSGDVIIRKPSSKESLYTNSTSSVRSRNKNSLFAPDDHVAQELKSDSFTNVSRRKRSRSTTSKEGLTYGFMQAFIEEGDGYEEFVDDEGITPLYKAASNGDKEALKWLLVCKWNIDIANRDGSTALHAAVKGNHMNIIIFLCTHNASINIQNNDKETPLHLACRYANLQIAKRLHEYKADLNIRNINDETPLSVAVISTKTGIAQYLLDNKCDPNTASKTGNTVLHMACKIRNGNMAKLLLNYNADPTIANFIGDTPFNFITSGNNNEQYSFYTPREDKLISHEDKQYIAAFSTIILTLACQTKDMKLFNCLIKDTPFSFSATKYQKIAPLTVALRLSAIDIAIILLDNGAELIDIHNNLPQLIIESGSQILVNKMFLRMANEIQQKKTTILDFSNCQLKYISLEFIQFLLDNQKTPLITQLTCLNLKHNDIQMLPIELLDLPEHIDIKLEGNPLEMIPDSQRKASWNKTKEYLISIRDRAKQWKDCKLLILGQESSGKSTLLRSLMSRKNKVPCKVNLSTNGIEFHKQIKFPIQKQGDNSLYKNIHFNAWDFGGQEIFYPTHRFFLTTNAVYIITFNFENILNSKEGKKEAEARISYWMQQVRLVTNQSSKKLIYIVGTHLDNVDKNLVNEYIKELHDKFPKQRFKGTEAIFAVSCRTGDGILELKEKILKDVSTKGLLPYVNPSWVKLYDYLFPQKQNLLLKSKDKLDSYITRKRFDLIAKRFGLDDTEISTAASFFQAIGTIILHKNDLSNSKHALKEIVILKPRWLADIMATLISFNHTWIKNGYLRSADIKHVFVAYDENIHDAILELLENFSIIYRVKLVNQSLYLSSSKNTLEGVFVPSLLPVTPSEKETESFWISKCENTNEIGRIYVFPFLPLGLIERIIVRAFHTPGFAPYYFWRYGAFLFFKSQAGESFKVFILFDPISFRLTIRMTSLILSTIDEELFMASKASIFSKLIDSIDTSLEEYKLNETTQRYIPCSHCVKTQIKKLNKNEDSSPSNSVDYSTVFEFTYAECVQSITDGDGIVFCHHIRSPTRAISIQAIAPDIALSGVPTISPDALTINEIIGKGGFGTVYKGVLCLEALPDTIIAIKEANISMSEADYIFADFRQEVFIMSQIKRHPNIVEFYGVTLKPKPQMILEFVPCGDLDGLLRPKNKKHTYETLPISLRLLIAWDIAKGMFSLHSQQPPIIHRDLRSPNIFMASISENAPVRAKVADFGLARIITPSISGVLDTWQWLAPEVIGVINRTENRHDASGYGQSSDVYSFAICCWELVTCKFPFQEYETDMRFCRAKQSGELQFSVSKVKRAIYIDHLRPTLPPPTTVENDGFPLLFLELIRDCWKTNPRERPTFKNIVIRLEDIIPNIDKSIFVDISKYYKSRRTRSTPSSAAKLQASLSITNEIESYNIDYHKELIPSKIIRLPMHLKISCCCLYNKQLSGGLINVQIWIGCERGVIIVLDCSEDSLPVVTLWNAHTKPVTAIANINNTIWSGTEIGELSIWDDEFTLIKEIKLFKKKKVTNIFNSSIGVWVSSENHKNIKILNTDGKLLHLLPIKKTMIISSIFEYNNVIWIGSEKNIMLYNTALEAVGSWEAHPSFVVCIINIEQNRIATACSNGEIAIWKVDGAKISCINRKTEQVGYELSALCNFGKTRILSTTSRNIVLWDSETIQSVQEIDVQGSAKKCLGLVDRMIVIHSSGKLSVYKCQQ